MMRILSGKKIWTIFVIASILVLLKSGLVFAQQIRVVATWPALADITRQIGKELVNVDSLASGVEDPHGVPMKPSFVPRLNRADVLVFIGVDDELSWLPGLQEVASNPKILPGQPGYLDCSVGIPVAEAARVLDRSEGDLHPKGNPHYLLDPVYTKIAAQNIAVGLSRNFPQHHATFEKNLKAYIAELVSWITRWEKMTTPLRGMKFVEYHQEWVYFANRYGLKRIGAVELKPGIEPTPNHIVSLVQQIKQEKAQVLLYGEQNQSVPQQISKESGIKVLRLYSCYGGIQETDTYI
jgi:zinc/manganese transport system substrate-binding protein